MNALLFATSPPATERNRPQGLVGLVSAFSSKRPPPFCTVASKLQKLHHAPAEGSANLHRKGRLSSLGATGTLGGAGLEAVLELAVDGLEVGHAAGASGLPSLGLLAPVDCFNALVLYSCRFEVESVVVQVSERWRVDRDIHFLTEALG